MIKLTFKQKCTNIGIFNYTEYICKLYNKGLSCNEIAEHFKDEHNISITAKHLSDKIKEKIGLRTHSERKLNAIKRGRMIYYKKPKHEKYRSGSISAKQRIAVLTKDDFKCTLCGNSPKTGYTLEIHHKNGTSSDLDNLQTLCYLCHRGLHATEKKV